MPAPLCLKVSIHVFTLLKIGYRITRVKIENSRSVSYEPFIYGWLDEDEQEAWGRPVDVLILEDGSMLISDDYANAIYRVYYEG